MFFIPFSIIYYVYNTERFNLLYLVRDKYVISASFSYPSPTHRCTAPYSSTLPETDRKGTTFERGGGGLGRTFIHKGGYLMTLKDIYIVLFTQIAYGFRWEKPLFDADTHRF